MKEDLCDDFQKSLVLDLFGELESKERLELVAHLKTCESCQKTHENHRRVLALDKGFSPRDMPVPKFSFPPSSVKEEKEERLSKIAYRIVATAAFLALAGGLSFFVVQEKGAKPLANVSGVVKASQEQPFFDPFKPIVPKGPWGKTRSSSEFHREAWVISRFKKRVQELKPSLL